MIQRKIVTFLLAIIVLTGAIGSNVSAQDIVDSTNVNNNVPRYLLQVVDESGTITEERLISDAEYQGMKNSRANQFMKEQYVSRCAVEVSIFYDRYLDNGVPRFSPSSITYVFIPNTDDLWHYNIVRTTSRCSGSLTNNRGSGTYAFTP